jgi:CheY-like chemotaxis protein
MDHSPRLDRIALVVDDDVFIVSALAELLEEDGYDVHTASNGFSAQRLVTELRPTVLLLDLALPERTGLELLRDLRADTATRDMAIVIVTGYPERLSDMQALEIDGIVTKPFDVADLSGTVHRAVQRAANRRSEVLPVAATPHPTLLPRPRRIASARRSHGRR